MLEDSIGTKPEDYQTMAKVTQLPTRDKVNSADTWDLNSLFPNDDAWEVAFKEWEAKIPKYESFAGKLADSAETLFSLLQFDADFDRHGERIGTYAMLKTTEDAGNSNYQGMRARYMGVASKAAQAASFIRPEILSIPEKKISSFLGSPTLKDFKLALERIIRYKPHTLSPSEEKLLAMQSEMSEAANQIFHQLNDADLKFGTVKNDKGDKIELSHGSYSACLNSPKREVRKKAFRKYYAEYGDHAHTLAASLNASIQRDIYYARARNYPSSLASALFHDNMPVSVYDNLISTVRRFLPAVHYYYDVRRRAMKLKKIRQFDTYVPIITKFQSVHEWDDAVDVIMTALQPLGTDYCSALDAGMRGRWCDRYENKGKQSGAFSCGSFDGDPYILMNYQKNVLNHVFTLAHEAGHSMHSYLSAKNQPFQYYSYTIFVAEVASTFNEQLLSNHLLGKANTADERAYYINREIDDLRGTIIRQTMFAEFEKITHEIAERNEPLTLERLQNEYRALLEAYFGPEFALNDELKNECLRIPHFYRAFYVYKYATGMSAAIALSDRVLKGGEVELNDYLNFLKGGCSKWPLDLLRGAGVDMEQPQPVETALGRFENLVKELDQLLNA